MASEAQRPSRSLYVSALTVIVIRCRGSRHESTHIRMGTGGVEIDSIRRLRRSMLSSISGSALRVSDAGKDRDKNAGAERRHAKAGRRMLSILGAVWDGWD